MTIKKDLPFDLCESCEHFVLDVDEQVLSVDGMIFTRCLMVKCKNEWLCKQLAERHGTANGRESSKESM